MSTGPSGDVSLIRDEDLLRKMWQDTADFGRKKEIRAHMYKLREARLRDFYNSGEVNSDIQRSTTTTTERKSCSGSTHADSLADHSFISLKTKEIRDSESPTKDEVYRITDKGLNSQGWTVVTSNQKSDDGKTLTTSKLATTSGTDKIEGGKIDYAAKNEQHASVYKDGDDKNFTKSVGASSNTFIKQEATGGDKNSSFKSSSTKSSSSSKVVTEQHSSSGDIVDRHPAPSKTITHDQNDDYLVSRKTYTENIPNEFKNHPNYVDGRTKVTRETRTMPDGSTVTTTKYEIKGANTTQSNKSSHYSTSEQKSSRSSQAVESKNNQNESRTVQYSSGQPTTTTTVTRYIHDSRDQPAATSTTTRTIKNQHTESADDVSRSTSVYDSRNQQDVDTKKTTVIRKGYDSREPLQDVSTRTTTIKQVYDAEPKVTQDSNVTTTTTVIKKVYDSRSEPTVTRDTRTTVIRNVQEPSVPDSTTTIKTAVSKNVSDARNQDNSNVATTKTTIVRNIYDINDTARTTDDVKSVKTGKTVVTRQTYDIKDDRSFVNEQATNKVNKYQANEEFINVEKQDTRKRIEPIATPAPERPRAESPEKRPLPEQKREPVEKRPKPDERYELPEKRQPIKPGRSEFDDKPKPTEGQYETTYRTDFTNKRISVDVSPTHDAFARSLRAVSPDRISKCSSPSRSLRTSTSSLRNSTSPEKNRHPSRLSPDRRSVSPRKATTNETVTHKNRINSDTLTRKTHATEIDSGTLTRRKKPTTRSRSPSPTTTASEIEFIRNTDIITDLDTNETTIVTQLRPSSLEITNKHTKKVTERSPTSPLTDGAPKKTTTRTNSLRNMSPTKAPADKVFKRTDTYEERCRQILGITSENDKRKITETRRTSGPKSPSKESPTRKLPEKQPLYKSPERKSPTKDGSKVNSEVRRSPEKQPSKEYPSKKSSVKEGSKLNEFPSQIRKSPEKEPLGPYPEKKRPVKDGAQLNEFPSQIRRSPEKEPLGPYPEKTSPTKDRSQLNEFPSQVKRTPEKEPLGPYPEKKRPAKDGAQLNEFPSQIRRIPEKEPLGPYPEKTSPTKDRSQLNEFPSQVKRTPEKEPLGPYPEKKRPAKDGAQLNEFPFQVGKTPEKEPLGPYPEKKRPAKDGAQLNEFPSQVRKTPEKEPLGPYPEKTSPTKDRSHLNEFPSQVKRTPEKEPLGPYPEKKSPVKDKSHLNEFPSQIRRSPEKEPLGPYPEKASPTKDRSQLNEFPSQVKRTPEKEPLGPYPEKKSPVKDKSHVNEFPSQVRRSPEKEPLGPYPERASPTKDRSQLNEFPSQIRKTPEREPLGAYPEKASPVKEAPKINEFPSQVRKVLEREPLEPYPEKKSPVKEPSKVSEFPSQIRRPTEREPLEPYPERSKPVKSGPQVSEFPSQIRKSPVKDKDYPTSKKETPESESDEEEDRPKRPISSTVTTEDDYSLIDIDVTSQVKRPTKSQPVEGTTKKPIEKGFVDQLLPSDTCLFPTRKPKLSESSIEEPQKEPSKPSQIKRMPEVSKSPEKVPLDKTRPQKEVPKISEFPSQVKKVPGEETRAKTGIPEFRKSPQKELIPRQRTASESSSSTDEEENVEQEFKTTTVTELEGRIPVDEPLATKKFISQLCREEEIQREDLTKKDTQSVLDNELVRTGTTTPSKTVKKPSAKKPEELFIEKEKVDAAKQHVLAKGTKKLVTDKNVTKTVKKVVDDKSKSKDVKKTTEKITLYDIENMNTTKEDNRVHIRTHRVDDTINKKLANKTSTTVNGTISKKVVTKRPQPIKPEEPKTKKPTDRSPKPDELRTKKPADKRTQRPTEPETKRITSEQRTPKRHIVTTTITVTPTTRPSPVKSSPKPKSLTKTVPAAKPLKKKPKIQNGHVSSDDESITESFTEEITEETSVNAKKQKSVRSDHIVKRKSESRTPVRAIPQTEAASLRTKQEKCITTKSIIINNDVSEREVIVDLQRSKSSREPTPDRVCPLPMSEYADDTTPRYPDQIAEPDDFKPKPKKLRDVPILEDRDDVEFSRITEIQDTAKNHQTHKTDISLSNIDKKINRFSDTTGKATKPKQGPAPKVDRPTLEVTEDMRSDECLLSVSEKVNKFITTAEQLTTPQDLPPRPKSPKCAYYPDEDVKVSDKVAHFITTAEKVITTPKGPAPKVGRPSFEDVDETMKEDECLLSVSDKVSKFINTSDRLTTDSKRVISLSKIDDKTSKPQPRRSPSKETTPTRKPKDAEENKYPRRDSSPKLPETPRRSPSKETTPSRKPSNQYSPVKKDSEENKYPRRDSSPKLSETPRRSPSKETTPTRKPSNQYSSIKKDSEENKYPRRDSSPKLPDSTPRSTRRPSTEETKSVFSPTGRLRSTETVKKAKALFENINKDQHVAKQRDILSRPSVFEGRKVKTDRKLEYSREDEEQKLRSTHVLRSRPKSPEKGQDVVTSRRSLTPEGDLPGYMRPLDRSLRPNSPHRESIGQINKKHSTVNEDETKEVHHTKFGVTLKRTDSGRNLGTKTTKSTVVIEGLTEADVEEIYEMEILEELLERVVSYELRRKIRTQIRTVKQLISEGKLDTVTKTITRERSPAKIVKHTEDFVGRSEYSSSYAYNERRSSSEYTKVVRQSPETRVIQRSPSPETKQSRIPRRSQSPDMKPPRRRSPESQLSRERTPDKAQPKATKLVQSQLKKSAVRPAAVADSTPEWVKQRNLRKVTDTSTTVTTTRSTAASSKKSRSSLVKESKPIDTITSSYGVGPTDENGSPLFGLKALRVQNKTDTTKVQGTVIRSQYYSENGQEPVGEISVTKYSSDPRDLGRNEDVKSKGLTSVTTTQKFGFKDTPSLKTLTETKNRKEICEEIEDEIETKKSSKVARRGSVKTLSQKFIDNAVETSKNEKQSSYPKAGLILRTSSFKDSASSGDSREGSAERSTTIKSSTTRTVAGETFLTNRSKVTGVQDVISRMKSEDIREGDNVEDAEARGLLNKFIGAQVILSGIESNVKTSTSNARRSTKITTTVTERGKPVTKTRVFHHPISDEDLQTVWDEQSLRLLLEQSTDYEERRQIRARLRHVMAEQEACTELVDKASQDQISTTFEGESQLLPLLQGLLEAPDNEQTADSGTESGEDQRSGLIAEVQNALDKLSTNLRDDATDLTPDRRSSLLQLVTKLQAGLAASVPSQERRSSVQGRFRRRQRPNRHTVGVSSEELADARRLIEEISQHDLTPQTSRSKISMLQKQNSEGSVGQNSNTTFKAFVPQKSVVRNAIAKPFSSSNSTVSGNSSSVQTPTEISESLDFLFNQEFSDKKLDYSYRSISTEDENIKRSSSGDVSVKSLQNVAHQTAIQTSGEILLESEETDEDVTMKAQAIKAEEHKPPPIQRYDEIPETQIVMQSNPIYQKFAIDYKSNKFNSKKLKMKRANTIDIPKPLNFYEDDADSDGSLPDEDYHQRRRSTYLALRGPIRMGNTGSNKSTLPIFEAKTDNDKKFLEFINKQNENTTVKHELAKNSIWAKPESNRGTNWSNKFGNIKTAFEKASVGPTQSQNSARQFWKTADDAVSSGPKYDGPKISKQSARNLRQMFEEKQKQSQWTDKNIVTGSLKVGAFEPNNDKMHKFVPQPLPVNKFSHAPQSAFKPIPKKAPPPKLQMPRLPANPDEKGKDLDSPLFLYSPPKPANESSLKPWVTNPGEHRVLSLAASKFENVATQEPVPVKPRRSSKDKVTLSFPQTPPERLSAPYLVKTADHKSSTVRQLSGQYDSITGKPHDAYSTYSTVKYTLPVDQAPAHHQQYNEGPLRHSQGQYAKASKDPRSSQDYGHRVDPYRYDRRDSQEPQNRSQYSSTSQQFVGPQENRPKPQQYSYNQQYAPQAPQYQNQHLAPQSQRYVYADKAPSNLHPTTEDVQTYSNSNRNSNHAPENHLTSSQSQAPGNKQYEHQRIDHVQNAKPTTPQYHSLQPQQQYNEPQYTSTYQFQPQTPPPGYNQKLTQQPVAEAKVPQSQTNPPKLDSQLSVESLKEYTAISSRVMTGPVSQQATTVRQKSPMNRDEHEIAAALSLRNALQKVSPRSDSSPLKSSSSSTSGSNNKGSPNKITSPVVSPKETGAVVSPSNYNYRSEDNSPCGLTPNATNYRNVEDGYRTVSSNNYNYREEPPKIMSPPAYNYKNERSPRTASPSSSFSYGSRQGSQKPVSPHSFSYRSRDSMSSGVGNYRSDKRSVPIECLEINDHGATHTKGSTAKEPVTTSQVTTRVTTTQQVVQSKKPISPFAKFRQLDKQNSLNSPSSPKTPSGSGPLFKFTDPAVSQSASTIKDRLLHWCRMKTKEYENIQLDNFSTSWADGLAFCALIHHFLPDAFDYHALSPKNRRHNFTLAFQVADEKADIVPLLDVDDMVAVRKPDWKCVFTYVQSIYRRFKDED